MIMVMLGTALSGQIELIYLNGIIERLQKEDSRMPLFSRGTPRPSARLRIARHHCN
ncbi:hypothetical protein MCP1_180034 [Candidatus Terasakiella magnetica]|nr:hypothetical protein MCP1_180034 [Candidatus Terasakiella magnetica]